MCISWSLCPLGCLYPKKFNAKLQTPYLSPVFFSFLKAYARFTLRIYCRRLVINKPEYLHTKGPLLFAANHPNSFLDGIILSTLLDEPLYSLARGDAFTSRWNGWLRKLHLLPVYRNSEGVENLAQNYTTFSSCHEVFKRKGVVLIFSEGECINEWKLRPLRKGTARLAISAWEKGIELTVVPLGFNYSSFRSFGKNVHLLFGEPIQKEPVLAHLQDGKQLAYFNQQLQQQLRGLVYNIEPGDKAHLQRQFAIPVPLLKKGVLAFPAALGWLLHAPLYYPAKWTAGIFETEYFDSVLVALLMLSYPFYIFLFGLLLYSFAGWYVLLLPLLLPFCAWACVQLKPQIT